MSSLTSRIFTLTLSEVLHYAIQFFSPIFLVRILDIETYGRYKEFNVYSLLILSFVSFAIKSNLLYFVSKDDTKEREYVTNSVVLIFCFSVVGLIIVYILKDYILSLTSYNFILLLIIYVFVYQNVDILESYWLAKKKTQFVLFWSTANGFIRTLLLIIVAYLTKDVYSLIYLFIFIEIGKTIFTVIYLLKKKLLKLRVDLPLLKEQMTYIVPQGISGVITKFNTDISKVIISSNLGAKALAIYSVGSQNVPLINIVRNSVSNVIFPEMAHKSAKDPLLALSLWNKSNLLYVFLMIPLFFIIIIYSELIVTILYTDQYHEAILLFQIYSVLIIRRCFEMSMPIRAMNKNKYFLVGNILSLGSNILLLYSLFNFIGFIGPAIAFILAEILFTVYLAERIIFIYKIKLSELLLWKKLSIVMLIGLVCAPILVLGKFININPVISASVLSVIYTLIYLVIIRALKIEEVDTFMSKMLRKLKLSW